MNISEEEKQAAFRARRFAPDRTKTYSIEERLTDLPGFGCRAYLITTRRGREGTVSHS